MSDNANPPAANPPVADDSLLNPPANPPAADGGDDSLINPPAPAAVDTDWLPDKFQVRDAEGKLDESASARKLAESYKALEAHKGVIPQPPESPEAYVLDAVKDAEGNAYDPELVKTFAGDPMFQGFAKDMHAAGITNEQMNVIIGKYLSSVPAILSADQTMSATDAKAELSKVWTDDKTMTDNLAGVVTAIKAFGAEAEDVPGSTKRLMDKYGRDPDFIAFAATVAKELKEDRPPSGEMTGSSEADIESLQRSEAYWKPEHPDHNRVKAKVSEFYTRKHGTKRR